MLDDVFVVFVLP